MLVYYLSIIIIALVIAGVVLAKLYISKIVDKSKSLIYFVNGIFILGFIDIFWGLTYYDCFGMGVMGLVISTSLFFSASAVISYGWFLYASSLINDNSMSRKESVLWFTPALFAVCLVIINLFTDRLFTVNGGVENYDRGPWYIAYRLVIDGYYLVIIIKAFLKYRREKVNKRKYFAIFSFTILPMVIEALQIFGVLLPFTTLAYTTAIVAIYIFVSVESEEILLKTANITNELALECITEFHQEIDYGKSMKGLLARLGEYTKAEKVYISEKDKIRVVEDFVWNNSKFKKKTTGATIYTPIIINKELFGYVVAENCPKIEFIDSKVLCETVGHFVAFKIKNKMLSEDLNKTINEKMQAKTTFLFNMSHDIRTPMNAILGFNEIARRNIDNKDKVMEALDKAKISGEHMLGLINDILEISRIENGKLELNEEVVNVKDHIKSLTDMFELSMREKGVDFTIVDETEEPYVYVDYLRTSQVIANLLSNAYKFTPEGGSVLLKCVERPGKKSGTLEYCIHVKDTGIGMSESFQKKVFESFERERTSTNSKIQGTGLGLAIAKKIADLMGGDLTCTSKIGKGTEFVFTFYARPAKGGNELIKKAENRALVLKGRRILVVEDNDLNREIVAEILRAEDCIVDEAENGYIAVEKVANSKKGYYKLILMDIQMPVMNGYEAVTKIRALENKDLANIPIIAMTANAFEEDRKRAMEAGMNAHVPKPIDIDNLLGTMMNLLQKEE